MTILRHQMKKRLARGLLVFGLAPTLSCAAADVLDTPAAATEKGHQHLLLDVENTGKKLIAVGARGHILLSNNDGENWEQVDVPVSVLLSAVDFPSANRGWVVGHGGVILATTDGGQSWVKQFDGHVANQAIIREAEQVVEDLERKLAQASDDDAEDIEYELEEAQFGLEDANFDAEVGASKPLLDVAFISENVGFVVGAYGFLFKTEDAGATWKYLGDRLENPDRFHLNTIAQVPGGAIVIAGEAGVMFRSENEGDSWELVDSPYDGSFFGLTPTGDKNVLLAYGLRGNLFRSEDAGQTWSDVEIGSESTLTGGSYNGSGRVAIVGNAGIVLSSSDGGRTFSASIRENRLGNASLTYLKGRRMVVVGESGVSITNTTGQNL